MEKKFQALLLYFYSFSAINLNTELCCFYDKTYVINLKETWKQKFDSRKAK